MIIFKQLSVKTPEREILMDITHEVRKILSHSNVREGICRIFVPHTTAALTINENADPNVIRDIINYLKALIPQHGRLGYIFRHGEGNSDAHIKSSLMGFSLEIMIHDQKLMLGTWQGIYLAEFDGPRYRKIYIQIQGE
ncbi:MAG: secondary thiamine-phosphate synthase enzyme YjbQ [Promethearchaeota archaeon]